MIQMAVRLRQILMKPKWSCMENRDGSLTLTNKLTQQQLNVGPHCVAVGCDHCPQSPPTQEALIQSYFTVSSCPKKTTDQFSR